MNAMKAMTAVLGINETLEGLKNMNMGKQPDRTLTGAIGLLTEYREVLLDLMENTEIYEKKS